MPTQWDSVLVQGVAADLRRRLRGARLRGVYFDREAPALFAFFREGTLEVRLHAQDSRVLWRSAVDPYPGSRSLPARVSAVDAPLDERRFTIHLQRLRGSPRDNRLEIELLPRRLNAIWVSGERVQAVLRSDPRVPRGRPYKPPERTHRQWRDSGPGAAQWQELLTDLPQEGRERALLQTLAWSSPLNAAALLTNGQGHFWGEALWTRLRSNDGQEPVLLHRPEGDQIYPAAVGDTPFTPISTLVDAGDPPTPPSLPADAVRRGQRRVTALKKKLAALERQLESSVDSDLLRSQADLLLARLRSVPRGVARVSLEGFAGEPVTLELDPTRSPQENAQDLYARARKSAKAGAELPDLIAKARLELSAAAERVERMGRGTLDPAEISALIGAPRPRRQSAAQQTLPFRTYRSSGGLSILVGRGARHNDTLTFAVARPRDIWLHARGVAGAHVVLRWDRDEAPPARDLEDAASLAALHSSGRHSNLVPVAWTRRKYVRKPRGAAPGAVALERESTVMAHPDAALAERLRADPPEGQDP